MPFIERLGEEASLPAGVARRAAQVLVVEVVDAQRVAVHQEDVVFYRRIGEQLAAGRRGEAAAEQEVAVAVHEIEPGAGAGQPVEEADDDAVERRLEVLVADPVLEEIAEHIQCIGAGGVLFYEAEEALIGGRALLVEVEIRDVKTAQPSLTSRRPPSPTR